MVRPWLTTLAQSGSIAGSNWLKPIAASDWRKLAAASGQLCESNIQICDAPPLSVQDIRNVCLHLQDTSGKPGLIVIDDLQSVIVDEANANQNTDKTARALKSLAAELNVPIILLSRLEHSKNQP